MFEDSLFASTARPNPRRGWTAIFSFAAQAMVLGVFVLLPLLYTDALPVSRLRSYVEIPPPPGRSAPPPQRALQNVRPRSAEIRDNVLFQPHTIPPRIARIVDRPEDASADTGPGVMGLPEGVGRGSQVMNNIIAAATANVASPRPAAIGHVRLSRGVTEGMLIHKVTPIYPPLAITAHVQGQVLLQATIGREGNIENLQVISGHPLLVKAAMDAVRQWRYRPYLLNNQPVDVETQITVNFTLGG